MTELRAPLALLLFWASLVLSNATPGGQSQLPLIIDAETEFSFNTNGAFFATNGVVVRYITTEKSSNAVLMADRISGNTNTGDIYAEGNVRLYQDDQTWTGTHLHYNFLTRQMDAREFRSGRAPYFVGGGGLRAETTTNGGYSATATNAMVTTDDYDQPFQKIRAKRITLVPGQYVEARNATVYIGSVPVFFVPYYHRDLTGNPNNFNFVPGYRGTFGPYLLSTYNWFWSDALSGSLHADWRQRRGFGVGPDVDLHLGDLGEARFRYYYARDDEPGTDPFTGIPIPTDRQRAYLSYDAMPFTNLTLKGQGAYQTDPFIIRDFFESQYRADIQPNSYFDVNKVWRNWSLDILTQARMNSFYETIERLPEARLTGFRQQLFGTPVFYESETTAGYYRRLFASTNIGALNFRAARADTFQQLTVPYTFFGWLNVTPRAGGRFTHYSEGQGPGATTTNENRVVFNTGAEVSFKASRVWSGARNHFWDVDGIRHIVEPSANYVFIPRPNARPFELPQFDYEPSNSLRMLPLEFPDYNSIDSIDSQNTIRFGLNNKLQTKRNGEIDNMVSWGVYTDWNLHPRTNQNTFSDMFSELELKPRSWLTLASQTRYDIHQGRFNLSQHRVTIQPNDTWSWSVGHFFLRDGPLFGGGNNLITSTMFYRFNENWGTRMQHGFDAKRGTLQEQSYTLYRDLRSWTAAVTFRVLDSVSRGPEYGVAITFSLKAFPRFGLGQDAVSSASLVGY